MSYTDNLSRINRAVTQRELLMQLAEECSELAQAALKVCRTMSDSTNPTPVSRREAYANLTEEYSDVVMVADVLSMNTNPAIMDAKAQRWVHRLRDNADETDREFLYRDMDAKNE